jgi:hypothetical protein
MQQSRVRLASLLLFLAKSKGRDLESRPLVILLEI